MIEYDLPDCVKFRSLRCADGHEEPEPEPDPGTCPPEPKGMPSPFPPDCDQP
jgi:hypothetical protein